MVLLRYDIHLAGQGKLTLEKHQAVLLRYSPLEVELPDVNAIQPDDALSRVIETQQQLGHGALATA
jgi:GTP cyclohydrolase III